MKGWNPAEATDQERSYYVGLSQAVDIIMTRSAEMGLSVDAEWERRTESARVSAELFLWFRDLNGDYVDAVFAEVIRSGATVGSVAEVLAWLWDDVEVVLQERRKALESDTI